eukprot:TRINITY_DN79957_c0_g1_i1.p1 TRINITY_DN79957_c0_g1~~TRINITY_DN79957_c0_g1_i1.p1  ORF type:complete len:122 (+),score=32.85 TRINITY_DN79957_c0_g1_i1:31-366(+)
MPMIPETPEHQTALIATAVMGPIGVCLTTICCQKTFCKPKAKPAPPVETRQIAPPPPPAPARDWAGERNDIIRQETIARQKIIDEWEGQHKHMKSQERSAMELLSEVTMEF